jgi:myosin protein heavy chain
MRPLLIASQDSKQSNALDTQYRKLQGEIKSVEKQKELIEEERLKALQDIQRLRKELEGERMLAFDKDEILKRSKAREADLEEQLNSALDDLDKLDVQCDELLKAKKKSEAQSSALKNELENGARIISALEQEKTALENRYAEIESQLSQMESTQSSTNESVEQTYVLCCSPRITTLTNSEKELSSLREQVSEKDAAIAELRQRLYETSSQLEIKLKEAVGFTPVIYYWRASFANKRHKSMTNRPRG